MKQISRYLNMYLEVIRFAGLILPVLSFISFFQKICLLEAWLKPRAGPPDLSGRQANYLVNCLREKEYLALRR